VPLAEMSPAHTALVAVVLAGGQSRRFGADKLDADLGDGSLLDHALAGLPVDADLIIVGPRRAVDRPARFVREDPAGTGPAAAMITGISAALDPAPDTIVVLPGDAPAAGAAAMILLAALRADPEASIVIATDSAGREQPLQLALRPAGAAALILAAGESKGAGQSARALLGRLQPPPRAVALAEAEHFDIDTVGDLQAWTITQR
jgi:molybdopterin-guanine dinucleotide biosynthesis protein A